MKKLLYISALFSVIFVFSKCDKKADFYYAKYLDEAQIALPSKVSSFEIKPGNNRAVLRFIVGADRRVTKLKISYSTSISTEATTLYVDVSDADYGHPKEVEINDIPEATLFATIRAYNAKGDNSNASYDTEHIYGEKYRSVLANRIFESVKTVQNAQKQDEKRIYFLTESGKPQRPELFYPLQKTIITYPTVNGGTKTVEMTVFDDYVVAQDIAESGTITHYSSYKPAGNSIDVFNSTETTETF